MKPILSVQNLKKYYELKGVFAKKGIVKALEDVNFQLFKKKTLAVVGESGCGKSTLAKTIMQIEERTEGHIEIHGEPISRPVKSDFYKKIQMIFQDPYSSINPRKKAWEIIAEPLRVNTDLSKRECYDEALKAMGMVGLRPEMGERFPHMFSGGQRQRIGIARALVLKPEIMILDEPVSALDVSIQAQIINLLLDLQDQLDLSYIVISHDLSVVEHICDDVMVMYLGRVVEQGERDQIFSNPKHPYTKVLLESTPRIFQGKIQNRKIPKGEMPSSLNPPAGCAFHSRCELAQEGCKKAVPPLEDKFDRKVACYEVKK